MGKPAFSSLEFSPCPNLLLSDIIWKNLAKKSLKVPTHLAFVCFTERYFYFNRSAKMSSSVKTRSWVKGGKREREREREREQQRVNLIHGTKWQTTDASKI